MLGTSLRNLRAERGWTIETLSQRLRFTVRQLEALEQGRFQDLSDLGLVRGMVRAYARVFGVDTAVLLELLEQERPDAKRLSIRSGPVSVAPQGVASFSLDRSTTRRWMAAALGVAILIMGLLWWWYGPDLIEELPWMTSAQIPSAPAPPGVRP